VILRRRYKTAGEDGIFPSLIQQGIETLLVLLCKILTACLAFGYVPKTCQKVRVIFILKPGCSLYELAKSFKPTSLTFFLLKRLVDFHIKEAPLKDYPLNPMQHAYLKDKSTETVNKIDGSLTQKEFAERLLDVEGAFDIIHLLN
jgi:hypothetical protein